MRKPPAATPYLAAEPGAAPPGAPRKRPGAGVIACLVILGAGAVMVFAAAIFAVIAFRRFDAAARTAEVKNTVAMIGRAQADAYEARGVLCGSASPVPAKVPTKTRYQPSTLPGEDFQKGSATDGWPCLRFAETTPIGFRYEMRVGGGYKGIARGAPDPGPDGFEVTAEGDLDGDGKTSLFVLVGRVDRATKKIAIMSPMFAVDETE